MAKIGREKGASYGQWLVSDPKAVLLLVHGLGAHIDRWEAMAGFFLQRGISSYAVELHDPASFSGKGEGPDGLGDYHGKILRLYDMAASDNPGKKIFIAGESLGAIISFLVCAAHPGLFNGLICMSPAFSPFGRISLWSYVRMLAPMFYNPGKQFALPFDSSMCTRDIGYRKRMDEDPREYRSISSRFILEIFLTQIRARAAANRMKTSVIFLVPGEDRIADPGASVKVFSSLAVKDKTLLMFPGMYHSLSIELGKEAVFEEILKWVEPRI